MRPAIERLLRRCIEDDNGCWVFTGSKVTGYAQVSAGRRGATPLLGHRLTYAHFIGEVPDGLDLDHLCRNRACCNPWHLDPVTRSVNNHRGIRGLGYRPSFLPTEGAAA